MHDFSDPTNIIDREAATSNEILGKECLTCMKLLRFGFFRRDSSYRDGYRDRCINCESSPYLSTAEHTARLQEMNFNSEGVKKQRWGKEQIDYMDDNARQGRWIHSSELISKLKSLVPELFITEGRFLGDWAVFRIFPRKQENGVDFKYLFFIPSGWMPEASFIEFDSRAIPVRERKRGWRTVLLRLIKSDLLSEETCNKEFGEPTPGADVVWNRELFRYRNRK